MTSIDEALSKAGTVAALGEEGADRTWLAVYAVGTTGAALITDEIIPRSQKRATAEQLRTRNVRVGTTTGLLVWVIDEQGFGLWSLERAIAEGNAANLDIGSTSVLVRDVVAVTSFVDRNDLGHRGVTLELRDGRRTVLVDEHDPAAEGDPTYNMDNVLIDGAWARDLGGALADWLRVPHHVG